MRLCGRNHLDELKQTTPSSIVWINAWSAELDAVVWKSVQEVINQFPSASCVDGRSFIFKVDGCNVVIETIIDFNLLLVLVTSTKVI
jgi:mRNA-degrading endonuclease HigB of HigAB toxin-antitoxin module